LAFILPAIMPPDRVIRIGFMKQVVNLYATYSNITIRPDREAILAELGRIARDKFQGFVTRNMITSLYMARRV
jgi:hypothetical protein